MITIHTLDEIVNQSTKIIGLNYKTIKKIGVDTVKETALRALSYGNPYMTDGHTIKYYIDGKLVYLRYNTTLSEEELNNCYLETAVKDICNGYSERTVGYYDKWYRYSRADEGRAYDLGQRIAVDTDNAADDFHIIEVNH